MPRPADRTIWKDQLAEKLGKHVNAAVRFLADSVVDANLPPAVRMEAATQILDRRFGKAVSRDVQVVIGQPKDAPPEGDISLLSTKELMRIAAGGLNALETPIEGEVVPEQIKDVPKPRQRRRKAL